MFQHSPQQPRPVTSWQPARCAGLVLIPGSAHRSYRVPTTARRSGLQYSRYEPERFRLTYEEHRLVTRRLFRRERVSSISSVLYGAIVAQARDPALYRDLGIADTVDGRFESVVLHLVVVLRRMRTGGDVMREAGQAVFDTFCQDMDRSLREMGVGDLAVAKRMRKIGEIFYGRSEAYNVALDDRDGAGLAEALLRGVPATAGRPGLAADGLAAYITATDAALAGMSDKAILRGETPRIEPVEYVAPETDDDGKSEPDRTD
ncbi:MAG: ubiquinol-cytochrome C chaperone [Hyphomicrobiales bacterium]|nr:ubiquinol-cytochrome C chaperone [Hyphomicrobiales bacterium]